MTSPPGERTSTPWERLTSFSGLLDAAHAAARGHRRKPAVAAFLVEREQNLVRLSNRLRSGSWAPGCFRTFRILEPKPRTISAAPFEDRVVHHALSAELLPIIERRASPMSFACREGRGTVAALTRARALTGRYGWFLKLDIAHYFETIPHDRLVARLRRLISCDRSAALCESIIHFGAPGSAPGHGLPIGNLTSQHFANDYLSQVDHHILRTLRVPDAVRYMDDFLLFADDPDALRHARDELRAWLPFRLGLQWKPSAERLGPTSSGVPFLGFRIWPEFVRLDRARALRVARRIRLSLVAVDAGIDSEELQGRRLSSVCAWSDLGRAARFRAAVLGCHVERFTASGRAAPTV